MYETSFQTQLQTTFVTAQPVRACLTLSLNKWLVDYGLTGRVFQTGRGHQPRWIWLAASHSVMDSGWVQFKWRSSRGVSLAKSAVETITHQRRPKMRACL